MNLCQFVYHLITVTLQQEELLVLLEYTILHLEHSLLNAELIQAALLVSSSLLMTSNLLALEEMALL